jgi:hypothetical protein
MRSITSLLTGLFALVALQTPVAEATPKKKHQHYSSCNHQKTVVVSGGYNKHKHHNHQKHSSASVVIVTSNTSPNYTYHPYYGYRRYYYTNPTPTYAQPPQPQAAAQPVVQNTRVREVGARFVGGGSIEGEQTALVGAGAYLRLRNTGRYLGFEASIDSTAVIDASGNAIANEIPLQAAALLYLNPRAPLRLFGLAGGGVALEQSAQGTSQKLTAQLGGGLDLDFTQRATVTLDVRGITSETTSATTRILPADPISGTNVVMNIGVSLKF